MLGSLAHLLATLHISSTDLQPIGKQLLLSVLLDYQDIGEQILQHWSGFSKSLASQFFCLVYPPWF